jgi:excisionase family DNA binding protein
MRVPRLNLRIDDLLTVEQAARRLQISVATLWRWKAQGDLVAISVLGRTVFDRAQIEALVRKRLATS